MVTDAIYPYHLGGKEVRYHHVVEGLAERGVEVHVFTMRWWEGPAHRTEGRVHYHAVCRRYPLYAGHRRSVVEAVMFALACLRLAGYRYDLIEADHMPHLQLFTLRLVAWLRRVPLVVTWHEFWGLDYWRRYLGRAGVVAAAIEQVTMRLGDAVLTPSPETAARLAANGLPRERVTVVPNGLDLGLIAATEPSPLAFDLLYVGRLVEHKHVDQLLDATAALRHEGRELTCGIVGEGPERRALEERAARLGLGEQVRFLGTFADHAEVFGLMKAARLFVLPSTREGFGIVVAEAIACGLAVVTTNHEDNHASALVEPGVTGWLCAATPLSLAQAVETALAHAGEATLGREVGLERFAWQASVASILDVFARARSVRTGDATGPDAPARQGGRATTRHPSG